MQLGNNQISLFLCAYFHAKYYNDPLDRSNIYLFKINNRNTEICKWSRYGFFIDNVEHTSHFF